MTDCFKTHKYYMKKATLQSKDIYNSGNDYDQSILSQPQPVDEYVTVDTFNRVVAELVDEINNKQDKLDIGFIDYEKPQQNNGG